MAIPQQLFALSPSSRTNPLRFSAGELNAPKSLCIIWIRVRKTRRFQGFFGKTKGALEIISCLPIEVKHELARRKQRQNYSFKIIVLQRLGRNYLKSLAK